MNSWIAVPIALADELEDLCLRSRENFPIPLLSVMLSGVTRLAPFAFLKKQGGCHESSTFCPHRFCREYCRR